jgi:putative ABC transport system ATP-binding protein
MTSAHELHQVSKVYGSGPSEVRALQAEYLASSAASSRRVTGPSGSGKSTLLTIAGSLEAATSGQVPEDGVDLASVSRSIGARMRRRWIGYVVQDFTCSRG